MHPQILRLIEEQEEEKGEFSLLPSFTGSLPNCCLAGFPPPVSVSARGNFCDSLEKRNVAELSKYLTWQGMKGTMELTPESVNYSLSTTLREYPNYCHRKYMGICNENPFVGFISNELILLVSCSQLSSRLFK